MVPVDIRLSPSRSNGHIRSDIHRENGEELRYNLPQNGRISMSRMDDFQAFTAIVDKGSLTAAARHLGRSLQSVSRSLAALEREVGVELIRRTTRRSSPTDAGAAFHRRLSAALAEIEAAKLETANRRAEATGLLRISASTAFAPLYIVPALPDFLQA